jgi:hypothetical protein
MSDLELITLGEPTRYLVDSQGAYLGGFAGAALPPGAIEVPAAPADARQIWDGLAWSPVPAPPLPAISDRQFAHGLAKRGIITFPHALAFVKTGEIPPALQTILDDPAFIASLPAGITMDDVLLLVAGATTFERQHPVSLAIIAAFGWDATAADAFWTECLAL